MNHRKHDDPTPSPGEIQARKQKLVEGGVIFVIALSLCIYLGIRFAQDPADGGEPIAASVTQPDLPPTLAVVSEPLGPEPTAAIAPAGTEPAGVVESEISATRGEAPPIEEILPEVPLVVTYSTAEKTFFEGRYGLAAGMFATYCDEHPENAWGHYMRGLSLWKAGDQEAARGALNEALRLKPDHFKSLINLARVELELATPDDALASIQRALDVAPENDDARRVLGRIYHELGRGAEAEAAYREVLGRNADDAWALNNLALLWIEAERFEQAVAPLARAAELAPEAAVIRNNLATALERTGHLALAREQFAMACELGSSHGEASLARLDAVEIPAGEAEIDLTALAAAWFLPGADAEIASPASEAVAAATFEESGSAVER